MPVIRLLFIPALLMAADPALQTALNEYRLGHLNAAEAQATAVSRQDPNSTEAKLLLSLVRAGLGNCESERTRLRLAWKGAGSPELRRLAGLAAVKCDTALNQPEAGVPLLGELTKAFPDDPDVLYLGAKLYMAAWNRQVAAMYAKTPASYRVNQLSGEIFETQNRFTEAAAEYAKAIAKNPEGINLHFRRGRALLLGSHETAQLLEARKEFEAELRLNAEDAAAVYQLGQICDGLGDGTCAAANFERAAALRPDFPEALLGLGKGRMREKRVPEAIELFKRVASLQPTNETAHYQLMLAYRSLGRDADAARHKVILDRLQRPPEGEFTEFLKKLGDQPVKP